MAPMHRLAGAADAGTIAALWQRAEDARRSELGHRPTLGPDPEVARTIRVRMSIPDAFAVLVEEDGTAVGMAMVLPGRGADGAGDLIPGLAHLSMIAVDPARWGRGYGKHAVHGALETAQHRGYTRADLWTHETNRRAQALYRSTGWKRSGRTKTDDHGERIAQFTRRVDACS